MNELAAIVPTRSRPHLIPRMIDAWSKTDAFDVADLLFVIDADDMHFDQYQRMLERYPSASYQVMERWQPLVPKLNAAAVREAPKYEAIVFMGDDHLPRTSKWAHQLGAYHSWGDPRILYGQDGFQNQRLPTWWSMDTRIIQSMGKMVPAPVQHLYCDNAVKMLGEKTGRLAYIESILIEHMHPVVGKAPTDQQYMRVNRKQQYVRDGELFRAWLADGLDRDARILASIGG
jgi:hypothetical protein